MGKRPNVTTNFLFDSKWEASIRKLKPRDFHKLFWELYDFQMSGGRRKVPSYEDNLVIGTLVSFIVPQIQNRIDASGFSPMKFKGGETFDKANFSSAEQASSAGRGAAGGAAGGVAGGVAGGALPKSSQVKSSQVKSTLSRVERESSQEGGVPAAAPPPSKTGEEISFANTEDGGASPEVAPPSVTSFPLIRENGSTPPQGSGQGETPTEGGTPSDAPYPPQTDKKQAYGSRKNVWLTPEGYRLITEGMGIPEAFINHFSEKLAAHNYQYPDHAAAIAAWWREENNKLFWQHASAPPENQGHVPKEIASSLVKDDGTFDTDDFFELAVKKALETYL